MGISGHACRKRMQKKIVLVCGRLYSTNCGVRDSLNCSNLSLLIILFLDLKVGDLKYKSVEYFKLYTRNKFFIVEYYIFTRFTLLLLIRKLKNTNISSISVFSSEFILSLVHWMLLLVLKIIIITFTFFIYI